MVVSSVGTMAIRPIMVTIDCSDPGALSGWWAERTGAPVAADYGEYVVLGLDGLHLAFQQVPDPTPGKNKAHLDFRSDDRAADVAAFVEAGAAVVAEHAVPEGPTWTVLADPEGNQFCLADAHG